MSCKIKDFIALHIKFWFSQRILAAYDRIVVGRGAHQTRAGQGFVVQAQRHRFGRADQPLGLGHGRMAGKFFGDAERRHCLRCP